MKILSKYKDYYDYLVGIYGEDPKLILDRRDKDNYALVTGSKIVLYIAGYVIEGLILENGNILYGEALTPYIVDKTKYRNWWYRYKWLSKHQNRDYSKSVHIKYKDEEDWYYLEPVKDPQDTNILNNCPILIKTIYGLCKYPKLESLKLPTYLKAETIYQWLTEWLSNQITEKEKQIKDIPDKLKIQNKGFDIKKSFRPNIK
jgi:hypothetical protein